MSNRLPEQEAEFRLVDPIAEEYRQTLSAYKQMFMDAILTQWAMEGRKGNDLGDEVSERIGHTLVRCHEYGAFTAEYGMYVSKEILDAICREWQLGDTFEGFLEEYERKAWEEYDPELPDVFKDVLE